MKCFKNFVQSAVNARRVGYENSTSNLVAEAMTFLSNSSHGYQILNRSRHTFTKHLGDEKTHRAINRKNWIVRFVCVIDVLNMVQLVKSDIEHKDWMNVGFFILQFAKLIVLELENTFLDEYCDAIKLSGQDMYTISSIRHYAGKNGIIASAQQWKNNGIPCKAETVHMIFQPIQQQISFRVLAAQA